MEISAVEKGGKFGSADDQILHARHDRCCREIYGHNVGSAEVVERHAAYLHVVARIERGHPAQIGALLAALYRRAPITSSTSPVSRSFRFAIALDTVAAKRCG